MTGTLRYNELERVGRLGNQLHEIASTVGIARRHGLRPTFPTRWSYRPYFSLPDEMFSDEPGIHPCSLPDVRHLDARTQIYLQDISLWADVADEVRELFAPSDAARERLARMPLRTGQREVVLHVRRGDNWDYQELHGNGDFYPVASLLWWVDAVRGLRGGWRHGVWPEHVHVWVVSDDLGWCRAPLVPALDEINGSSWIASIGDQPVVWPSVLPNAGDPRLKEHEPGYWEQKSTDWADLLWMAQRSEAQFVISNSSFGWWGAWLSGSTDVSYQWPFYGPALSVENGGYCDATLMFPPEWTRLPL
jgi:hypothetical protein